MVLAYELLHYVLIAAVAWGVYLLVGEVAPGLAQWQEMVIMLVVAVSYVWAVVTLGLAPASWFGRDPPPETE